MSTEIVPADMLAGLQTVRDVIAPDLTPTELQLFAMVAARSGLDPFARQIYAVKRKGRVTFQTGIDGYRSIAARTGEYDGQDEPIYQGPCPCGDKGHPELATVRVYRKGVGRPIAATAYWHEYVPTDNDFMWRRMPHVMIAKVAEALALRKAFPWDPTRGQGIGADLYTEDEMAQADKGPSVVERLEAKAAEFSLADFKLAVHGIPAATVKRTAEELFPGRKSADLTAAELERLAHATTDAYELDRAADEAEDDPEGGAA